MLPAQDPPSENQLHLHTICIVRRLRAVPPVFPPVIVSAETERGSVGRVENDGGKRRDCSQSISYGKIQLIHLYLFSPFNGIFLPIFL